MINDKMAEEMLRNINMHGSADDNAMTKPLIGGNISHVLNLSSGLPRIHANVVNRFHLILSTPLILSALSAFEIRCCLCKKVISYPCWYYSVKYVVNQFHYFICFDRTSINKPNAKCFKRND